MTQYRMKSADPSQLQGERVREKVSLRIFAQYLAWLSMLPGTVCIPLVPGLALNVPRGRLQSFGQQLPGPPAPFAAFQPPRALLWPSAGRFQELFRWLQKATLFNSLALSPSRRPCQHFGRQHPGPPAPFAAFSHLSGAFKGVFYWLQKATLGSSLALNPSRRPCQRFGR